MTAHNSSRPRRAMARLARAGALLVALALPGRAAPLEADLGEGLAYHRVRQLPADLPPPAGAPGALVLDLRFTPLADGDRAAVEAWLRFRVAPKTPALVLVNGETAPGIAGILAANRGLPGLITLGLPTADYVPDLVVKTTPARDRRAYAALDEGTAAASLIAENPDKPRYDESSMMRERSGVPADVGDDDAPDDREAADRPRSEPSDAVVDATLQRAVHVHRALKALHRL